MDRKESETKSPLQFSFIRDDWISKRMVEREHEFTDKKEIVMFVGTWNVNAKKPSEDLTPWLCVNDPSDTAQIQPDVYVIGFQEIVDLNASSLLVENKAAAPWAEAIEKAISDQYEKVDEKTLVGIVLFVYVHKSHRVHVTDVQHDSAGVGIMGVGGNKGGVAITVRFYDSTICFVNSHLAAHKNNVQGRNSDYANISQRLKFIEKSKPRTYGRSSPIISDNKKPKLFDIYDHDIILWLGDLNYRLDLDDLENVYELIKQEKWDDLLHHDQLLLEQAAGNTFIDFKEGVIKFPPTYKYQPGTEEYERREDKKQRMPAWCDRIFWKDEGEGENLLQTHYARAELQTSDHKPVLSVFDCKIKVINKEKQTKVYKSLIHQLDKWENQQIPKVEFNLETIKFIEIRYDKPVTQYLVIKNTGQVSAKFKFVPKLQESSICKPWLKVEPETGLIPPGDSFHVSLTVHVTGDTARDLTYEQDQLDDILILGLERGRDFFIEISGQYMRSCFGTSIEFLVKIHQPVRNVDSEIIQKGVDKVLNLPKELWRIVDYIFKYGMGESGLFLTYGNSQEMDAIRESLDTGQDFKEDIMIHSMAECLIRFLESLAEPVFPPSLCASYTEGKDLTQWCRQAVNELPLSHYNAFIYMITFLREVLKRQKTDSSDRLVDKLVLVFASGLMHVTYKTSSVDKKPWKILRHFLTCDVMAST